MIWGILVNTLITHFKLEGKIMISGGKKSIFGEEDFDVTSKGEKC